jgi:hypothetical protein
MPLNPFWFSRWFFNFIIMVLWNQRTCSLWFFYRKTSNNGITCNTMVLCQFFHENHLNNRNWRFLDGKKTTSNSKPEIGLGWSSWIMILNIISLLSSQLQSTVMKWLEVSKTKVILEIGIPSTWMHISVEIVPLFPYFQSHKPISSYDMRLQIS